MRRSSVSQVILDTHYIVKQLCEFDQCYIDIHQYPDFDRRQKYCDKGIPELQDRRRKAVCCGGYRYRKRSMEQGAVRLHKEEQYAENI